MIARSVVAALLIIAPVSAVSRTAGAMREEPAEARNVSVTQRLDEKVPLDAAFRKSDGTAIELGDLFRPKRPVIVTLNYSNCPMLCSLQLDGVVEALRELEWTAGDQFDLVTVSIDPKEKPSDAAATKQKYLEAYARPEAVKGWHFLTGDQGAIDAVARAIGVRYHYLEDRNEYVHPAVMVLLTPSGQISRYMLGLRYSARELRRSLVEASQGAIGNEADQGILLCFQYLDKMGANTPMARNMLRWGGIGTLVGIVGIWGGFRVRKRKDSRS